MTVQRLEVEGLSRHAVAELDARLSAYAGGAQMWHLAGTRKLTAVGILIPDVAGRADRCREIVEEWKKEQRLA